MDKVEIGALIKEKRLQLDLTQNEFGEKLGVSGDVISLFERGKRLPHDRLIFKINKIYRLKIPYTTVGKVKNNSDRIRVGRYKKNLTMLELASLLDVNITIISRWEKRTARVPEKYFVKIEEILGVKLVKEPKLKKIS